MDGVSLEGDAVIEDGLGPDDEVVGNVSPKSEKCAPAEGPDGRGGGGLTPLSRTKSRISRRLWSDCADGEFVEVCRSF